MTAPLRRLHQTAKHLLSEPPVNELFAVVSAPSALTAARQTFSRFAPDASRRPSQEGSGDASVSVQAVTREQWSQQQQQRTLPYALHFDTEQYFRALATSRLGHSLLFAERVTSTQSLLYETFTDAPPGTVITAHQQVAGKGRGKNSWVSPAGSLCVSLKVHTRLPERLPLLQYVVGLSLLKAVDTIHTLPLRLKWPNDIYSPTVKLGGVLCQSAPRDQGFDVCIGVGINVSNAAPTTCLNALAHSMASHSSAPANSSSSSGTQPFTCETLLARFLSEFERDHSEFEQNGFDPFVDAYTATWLHSDQAVRLAAQPATGSVEREVRVCGLTKDGFLRAQDSDGREYALHPDGNSLDMLQGLIVTKTY